ncbi:MAG TPA: TolC family protein [Vicinamibacterales bacterium]|nr:TolC family protein [Vicinamibacterales bacterium]
MRVTTFLAVACALVGAVAVDASAQTSLTWMQVKTRFETNNPTIHAGQLTIDEARADELTAFLRPNPDFNAGADVLNVFKSPEGSGVFDNSVYGASIGYLVERRHKRELRRDSALGATAIATSTQADLVRTLTFTLRGAFVQLLQAKAFLTLAQTNLSDYDGVLGISRDRLQAGDIAQVDFDRLLLQRVQYESDVQTALVNVRTAKIQLLALLNDTTPVDQFDVTGAFDYAPLAQQLEVVRQTALSTRPDLKAAAQAVDKARVDYRLAVSNGSTDPTISLDFAANQQPNDFSPPVNAFVGVSVDIPLRIFDKNQGEKQKTKIDITRNEHLAQAARLQVLSDVDSAYATLASTIALLDPYKSTYLATATRVRDTMQFSYQRGGVALIDFLQAQQDYRTVQIGYINLVGSFLDAAAQLNLAVGQEVIP